MRCGKHSHPLTYDTTHPTYRLFDVHSFKKMSKNALLINAARGKIVDETALMGFLATGGQAVLDVYQEEPTPKRQLIEALALATPHIAGHSIDAKLRGTQMVYEAFCRHFGLPILAHFEEFLPDSPYGFSKLAPNTLQDFYDIKKDDQALRAKLSDGHLLAQDFDDLRRHTTRREWRIDITL